jgi:hypothetical protein
MREVIWTKKCNLEDKNLSSRAQRDAENLSFMSDSGIIKRRCVTIFPLTACYERRNIKSQLPSPQLDFHRHLSNATPPPLQEHQESMPAGDTMTWMLFINF